jgi:hypothetical protein
MLEEHSFSEVTQRKAGEEEMTARFNLFNKIKILITLSLFPKGEGRVRVSDIFLRLPHLDPLP